VIPFRLCPSSVCTVCCRILLNCASDVVGDSPRFAACNLILITRYSIKAIKQTIACARILRGKWWRKLPCQVDNLKLEISLTNFLGMNSIDKLEKIKASTRAKVEHPFRVIKCQFCYRKTGYRGLVKNTAQLITLFALSNLWMVRKRMIQAAAG
jgi:hypothetical protein